MLDKIIDHIKANAIFEFCSKGCIGTLDSIDFDVKRRIFFNISYTRRISEKIYCAETTIKILEIDNGIAVILSPHIYTAEWDIQTRVFIYLHEVFHVANKKRIPKPEIQSPSLSLYFENIYRLFDEYVADRQALELIDKVFPLLSDKMRCSIDSNVDGRSQSA